MTSDIRTPETTRPLEAEELRLLDASWCAANYLPVGQIYLRDNPLLRELLQAEHVKPHLSSMPSQDTEDRRLRARAYTREHGEDDPAVRDWTWPY